MIYNNLKNDKREFSGSVLLCMQQEGECWREYPPHFFGASKIFLLHFCFVTGPSVDLNPLGDESHK